MREGHPLPFSSISPLHSQWHEEAGPSSGPAQPPNLQSSVLPTPEAQSTNKAALRRQNNSTGVLQPPKLLE